jgi:cyclophilin family peptidyl-prolyl cis-trans isomerase
MRATWASHVAVLALLILAFTVTSAQDNPAIVTTAGTPAGLCEAAGTPPVGDQGPFTGAEQVIEAGVDYRAIFCTSAGPVYIDLLEAQSPITVNNLLFLAYNGYYNTTIFHRVMEDFMAQGGDPQATGTGGPGYQFEDEFTPYLTFDRPGWLAMANAGAGTNGSQFFITTVPTPHLDYKHTIYGQVLEGQENVEAIQIRDPQAGGDATTLNTVLIVTDPSLVETTFVPAEPATQEELAADLSADSIIAAATNYYGPSFPTDLLTINSRSLAPDDFLAELSASARTAGEALFEAANVAYVLEATIDNTACDLAQIPFVSLTYRIYGTDSKTLAAAALSDPGLTTMSIRNGLSSVDGFAFGVPGADGSPVYIGEGSGCEVAATRGRTYVVRGRYLVELEAVIPADVPFPISAVLEQLSAVIFERALIDPLLAELQ